jgi:hypothetical protein
LLRICFALISTEEALNPTYVIGARKRAGELLVSPLAAEHPGTRIMAVRLGPGGHFKFPHLWPLKLPQAGRSDYGFPDPV